MMLRRISVLALAATVLLLTGCVQYRAKGDRSTTAAHVADSPLVVDTRNGAIEVIADPNAAHVGIDATIVCTGDSQEEAEDRYHRTELSVLRGADGALTVKPVFADGERSGDGARIAIRIPDANGVHITTSNGSITINGTGGELYVRTSNGSVRIEDHDGPVDIDTSNGHITLDGIGGDALVRSSNGNIQATSIAGTLDGSSSNGALKVESVEGAVVLDSSNGRCYVRLDSHQPGPIDVDTSNGSVEVIVGAGFTGTIDMDTSNGRVSVDDPDRLADRIMIDRDEGRVVIGSDGPRSVLESSNGSIVVRVRG